MKTQKFLKASRTALAVLLCIVTVLATLSFTSCQVIEVVEETVEIVETVETEERKSVVRVKKGVLEGVQISGANLEVVEVPVSGIPDGAIDTIDKIVGKYAAIDIVMGEYVFDRMLTNEPPVEDVSHLNYIVLKDRADFKDGDDITSVLQETINSFPGRTVYISDGEYVISSPIKLSTEEGKAVSLRLSNYATVKAAANWSSQEAMISVGAGSDAAKASAAAVSVMGGVIDGSGVAQTGISVENGERSYISEITVKNCKTAVHVKETGKYTNLDKLTVVGDGKSGSLGIFNEANGGVFAIAKISNVELGVKNEGTNNEFRNISVEGASGVADAKGFYENSAKNVFSFCTADNCAKGFFISGGVESVFEACNVSWSSASVASQTAFFVDGAFASVISVPTVKFFDATSQNSPISFSSVSGGILKAPIFNELLCDDLSYKTVLTGGVVWAQ